MKKTIKDIASIQTGLFAKPAGIGDLVYLQSKHFDEYGQLNTVLHPDLAAEGVSEKHLLKDGDVLFAAKGTKNFAAVFELHNEPSVASTSFFVLRTFDERVLPQYLAWFLNNHTTQNHLKGQAIGTGIPSISKQVLENVELPIPSLDIQKSILNITKLRTKEKSLKQKIETLREKQIQQIIISSINQ
ncbi:restriction endonuclease subunit S [Aquirufa nivalisilvae]|uniref:restriction endonuclease subunit S n=1 Tax=Aquirufa nivalisilvae TaxID=2516557 RepID=UPI00137593F2|nr:restriction endonuclease subunit S [Aquirufa nivalisilvae]